MTQEEARWRSLELAVTSALEGEPCKVILDRAALYFKFLQGTYEATSERSAKKTD